MEELIAADKNIRISAIGTTPLHYLVADAKGKAATIEFFNGKMKVHKDESIPVPVLANDRYDESVDQTKRILKTQTSHSFTSNSIDRFAKACQLVNQSDASRNLDPVDYSFDILDQVAQGSHTKWSIVYDIAKRKIHFRSLQARNIKELSFASFDFSCATISKTYTINQPGKGDISQRFFNFSIETNSQLVNQSFDESKREITVSEKGRYETAFYPSQVHCFRK